MGTNVVWTYLVTNPGTSPLTIITITDDAGTPNNSADDFIPRYVSGDTNGTGKLDTGETWLYTSAGVITYTVQPNLYGNIGRVTGTSNGQTVVSAGDPSYLLGNTPTLFVQKAINAANPMNPTPTELAQAAPGRPLPVGTVVVWTYKVYNLGDGPMQITSLRDDAGTPADTSDDFSPTPVLLSGSTRNIGDADLDGLLDTNEAWLYSSRGFGSGTATVPDWDRIYQDVLNATDTSGSGTTPGFAHDPVGTPNSFSDNIFTGGGSKDTLGISQWQWKMQQPQDKNDIAHAFGASYADAATGHQFAFGGLDRYAANGAATVGFWFLQSAVAAAPGGTFRGGHTNGDLLLVVDFTVGGSTPVVNLYRWNGSDATGSLTAISVPAGSTFARVSSGSTSVPWSFIDKFGNTSPQAGELLTAGVDLTALFGAAVPRFVSFLAETRSSASTTSTLSDFALGRVNAVQTRYTVKPGPYSNTVTAFGRDPLTSALVTATNTNYHFGVANGPQLAVSAPGRSAAAVPVLTEAALATIVAEAKARWLAWGASPEIVSAFSIGIADLPDGEHPTLGYTSDRVILDSNAGGFGWFIDPTPSDDVEFGDRASSTELRAIGDGLPAVQMDLLTVVMHELGHVLGLADLPTQGHAHDLMAETLATGTRRLPGPPDRGPDGSASDLPLAPAPGTGRIATPVDRPTRSGITPVEFIPNGSNAGGVLTGGGMVPSAERRFAFAPVSVNMWRAGLQGAELQPLPATALPPVDPRRWPEEADVKQQALDGVIRTEECPPVADEVDEFAEFLASLCVALDERSC